MQVRMATIQDIPEMIRLGRLMHQSSTYSDMHYDPRDVGLLLTSLIEKDQFVAVIEVKKDVLVGVMVGMIAKSWFGQDAIASELAVFAEPGQTRAVPRLIKAFIQWSKLAGAKQIRPGVSTGDERAVQFYEKLGFKRVGATMLMAGE